MNWMDRLLLVDIRCKSLLLLNVAPRYSSRDVEVVGKVLRRRFKLDTAAGSYAKRVPIISHTDNFRSRRNSCDAVCIRYREISHREVNAVRSKMRAESTADTRGQILDSTLAIPDRFLEPILPREPRHACEAFSVAISCVFSRTIPFPGLCPVTSMLVTSIIEYCKK